MLRAKKKKLNKQTFILLLGIILVFLGLFILSYEKLKELKYQVFDEMNYKIFMNTKPKNVSDLKDSDSDLNVNTQQLIIDGNLAKAGVNKIVNYIGYLEIPKVDLKKGLVSKKSSLNNVNYNLYTLKESTYPDVDNSNLIIAGHSGTLATSYFKNLWKLKVGDMASVYYNNFKYNYKITKIYLQDKTGKIAIHRNYDKTTLTLITCTLKNDKKQTIYIAELVSADSI